ncbi:MAG: hypothetical protein Kow0047_25750 [Anaerolineae bacterium]
MPRGMPTRSQLRNIIRSEIEACLKDSARYVRSKAAKYPPQNPQSTYRRTGTLSRSMAISRPRFEGRRAYIEVGTNVPYARYVEFGTGIYGPKKQPIRPVRARALAWHVTGSRIGRAGNLPRLLIASGVTRRRGRTARYRPRDIYLVFARSVRGFPGWHFMQRAFEVPDSRRYFQSRLQLAVKRIGERLGKR